MKSVRSKSKVKLTAYYKPMLATSVNTPFNDPNWIFEIKWDGYRAIAEAGDTNVELYSRNGLSFKQLYPGIVNALQKFKSNAILDGEIVVFNDHGKPDFQKLQQFGDFKKGSLVYYVFDCLAVDGKSIMHLPLLERKKILKSLIDKKDAVVRFADHVSEQGIELLHHARQLDLEGIIAKRADSIYQQGKRSPDWLKIKNHNVQEAIIAGYTAPKGSRPHFGALILAIMEQGKLRYIGHTGTGFSNRTLHDLYQKLKLLKRATSPFASKVPVHKGVIWVEPKLVCNIKFSEITQAGILRHPVFMGLRIDKKAKEADHLEVPVSSRKTTAGTKKISPKKDN